MNMLQKLQKTVSAKAISMLLVVSMLFGALPANTVLVANAAGTGEQLQNPIYNEDGTVTFNLETDATSAGLKGTFTGWETVSMNKVSSEEGDFNEFTLTMEVPFDGGLYEYGMVTGEEGVWTGDPANPTQKGNPVVVRNPVVDNGTVSIYYPSADSTVSGNVLYRKAGTADEYEQKALGSVDGATGLFVAIIDDTQADVEYEYLVQIGEQEATYDAYNYVSRKVEEDVITTTFTSTKAIEEPEYTSPVVNADGSITFNYWAPSATTVLLAGDMNEWTGEAMTKNEENGLFSITQTLAAGPHEYKFVVDGNWIVDPKNKETQNGNSLVIASVPEGAVASPVYNEDGTVTFNLETKETVAKLKGMFTGWETVSMNQVSGNDVDFEGFTLTMEVPYEAGLYEYGMVTGAADDWQGDPVNPTTKGNPLVVRNPKVDNGVVTIYYPTAEETVSGNVLYRVAGSDAEYAKQPFGAVSGATGLFAAEISDAEANVEYEYLVQIGEEDATYDAYNWINRTGKGAAITTTFISTKAIEEPEYTSPVINADGSITFNYWAPSATTVLLAGDMNEWTGEAMTKNEENGLFSITQTLAAGPHEYKFVVDGNWIVDPKNNETQNGNSLVVAPVPEAEYSSPVINNDGTVTFNFEMPESDSSDSVALMGTLTDWDNGAPMEYDTEKELYTITLTLKPGKYQYKFKTANANWYTDPLNAEFESGNSLVRVPGLTVEADNLAGIGPVEVVATIPEGSKLTGEDLSFSLVAVSGNSVDVKKLHIEQDPEDKTKAYVTADADAENGFFKVVVAYNEDGADKTSELQLYHTQKAYLYEYEYKEDSTHKGKSDIYVWYNSQAGNVGYSLNEVNGDNIAYITIDDTTQNFGYIARLDGMWGASESEDREFGDRTLYVNPDDRYTKVKGGEGIQNAYLLPSGKTSYDNGIKFAYRDDERFYYNTMDELADSEVKVLYKLEDEETYKEVAMEYSERDELFTYLAPAEELAEGNYEFYFTVSGNEVKDQYMDGKIEFRKPTLNVEATVTPEEADYDMNPVVSFDITSSDGSVAKNVISSITADLTNLGYEGQEVSFSPTTLSGVLYIDRSVAAGTYKVPCTITDIWGNDTVVEVEVKVVARTDASPSWDESNIYFLLTDRFVDGDSSNNYNVNKGKIEAYHGGDFKGLTSKLSYLQNLGVNTIWITPIVDNIEDVMNTDLHQQAYHGYWAKDFTKVDEHLGNTEDLDNLIDEAAKRGIKVMVDIVVNHAGYKTNDNANFSGMLRTDEELVPGDVILDELDGLPDFKTEEEAVRAQLVAWQTAWANHETKNGNRIAYFRVDTVKHVDHETWAELKTSVAKENPTFKMIGEYYGASINNTGDYLGNGQMDAVLDFDFKSQAGSFVNGSLETVESALEARNSLLSNSLTTGQFLSSHDEDGFLASKAGGDTAKAKVAAALQLTAKGVPVIYYGEEIALTGMNVFGDQDNNRYDMQFEDLTEEQEAMLAHYQKLLAARNMYADVFAAGNRTKVAGSDADGYMVFKRSTAAESVYVALNNNTEAKEVTFSVSGNDATSLYDAYNGTEVPVKDGKVTVTIPANSDGGTVILGAEKVLADIVVTTPYKTAYKQGETLDLTGLVVTGYYGGSRVVIQPDAYTVNTTKYNKDVEGTYEIVVSYGDYSKSFKVSVVKADSEPQAPQQPKEIEATGVTLSETAATIAKGKTLTLTANVAPADASNKAVVFTSDNEKVATVTSDGVVTAIAAGSATITATTINGKSATCKITVTIPATKVYLNQSLQLKKGATLKLTASVLPTDSTDKLTWKSSNPKKVSVNANGKIKALKTGSATITVTTESGKSAKCKVTVVKKATKATKVKIKSTSKTMKVGAVKQLKVTIKPAKATSTLRFKTSNKNVVSVAKNGVITAKKKGKATITVIAGKQRATITIRVK